MRPKVYQSRPERKGSRGWGPRRLPPTPTSASRLVPYTRACEGLFLVMSPKAAPVKQESPFAQSVGGQPVPGTHLVPNNPQNHLVQNNIENLPGAKFILAAHKRFPKICTKIRPLSEKTPGNLRAIDFWPQLSAHYPPFRRQIFWNG